MTISLVSTLASSGNPLAALAGSTAKGDIFSILFQQFLAGAGKIDDAFDRATTPDLSTLLAQLEASPEASGLDPATLLGLMGADAAVFSPLPEEIQSLLGDLKKRLSQKEETPEEETPGFPISLLGALSAPVEPSRETASDLAALGASPKEKADPALMLLAQQMRALELEKAVARLPSKSANLAVGAEDFSQLLRENLLQGQARHLAANAQGSAQGVGGQGLQTPVMSSSAWAQEFGEKIVWMARSGQQSAQLSLNPAHLGPLSITLNLEADKASATFAVATQEVRQAIEDAMPRLREMLAAAGVALGETSVGTQTRQEWQAAEQQAAAQQDAENAARRNARETRRNGDGADEAILGDHLSAARIRQTRHGAGMVDLFA
jgi:flagellar hook-length control protein FliK